MDETGLTTDEPDGLNLEDLDLDFSELLETATDWVRDHPWLAVGVAAGAGFLLGTLVSDGTPEPKRQGSVLRQTAAEVGRELESQAADFRRSAAHKLANVASTVVEAGSEVKSSGTQAAETVTDTLKTTLAAIAFNKLGEWLKRSA